ncbi:imm11 family protein [Vibrio mexicanus]|uniref:imm11 family protein n=1 Tax=Vibrio mexicanus TaxID=1004326 RepID=UPI00063C74C9|nr:DUF1629 domain-containing protein [Vibrio mexicanus]
MNYDQVYYVMAPSYSDENEFIHVTPTEQTGNRRFHYRELTYGEPPVNFVLNDAVDSNVTSPMYFCKPSIIVSEELGRLLEDKIYGGKLYPASLSNDNTAFDGYLLVNIYEDLDCWCRKESVYKQKDPDYYPRVYQYRIDSKVIEKIDEERRLVFRMGGSDLSPVIVHEKVKNIVEKKMDNVNFFSIQDYFFGDEY